MNILLIAATSAEIAPLTEYIAKGWIRTSNDIYTKGEVSLQILITGVGLVAATYHLTRILGKQSFDLALLLGIGGSFDRELKLGEVVFVQHEQFGDMGAEDHYNFLDIFELGLEDANAYPFSQGILSNPLESLPVKIDLPKVSGITINTVSGTSFTALLRLQKYKPQLESMEGAALHYVCLREKVPFAQIRSISNYVEARDKSKWELGLAIRNLNNWAISFLENTAIG